MSSIVSLLLYSCTDSYSAHLFNCMVSGRQYVDVVSRRFAYLRVSPIVPGSEVDHGCNRPIESFVGLPPYGGLVEWDFQVKRRFLYSTSPVHCSDVLGNYSSIT